MFLQQLINGLSIGSVYALMAVGYSLIYSLLRFTNFAHGIVVTLAAYFGFYALTLIRPEFSIALLTAIAGGAIVSVLIELTTYRPLLIKNVRRLYLMIAGLGLSILAENLIVVAVGGRYKPYAALELGSKSINFLGATIGATDLLILAFSLISLLVVQLFIQYSREGLAIRGSSFSLDITSLMGVNTDRLMIAVFLLAGLLAGSAGFFLGLKYTAYPKLGALTTKAFISAVLGGLGSLPGAVLGALILGVLETMVSAYWSSALRDLFSFGLLIIILLIKPSGLLGKSSEDKA